MINSTICFGFRPHISGSFMHFSGIIIGMNDSLKRAYCMWKKLLKHLGGCDFVFLVVPGPEDTATHTSGSSPHQ